MCVCVCNCCFDSGLRAAVKLELEPRTPLTVVCCVGRVVWGSWSECVCVCMCHCGVGSVLAVVEELELDEGSFDIDIGVLCSIIQLLTCTCFTSC